MIAIVISAGRLLEHVMRLAALSPDINPEYLSCFSDEQVIIDRENNKNFKLKSFCIIQTTFFLATDGYTALIKCLFGIENSEGQSVTQRHRQIQCHDISFMKLILRISETDTTLKLLLGSGQGDR